MPDTGATYRLCGLTVRMPLLLPHLSPTELPPDATVTYGTVPQRLEDACRCGPLAWGRAGTVLLDIPLVGRIIVQAGREVVVEPAPALTPEKLAPYLLGTTLAALLHQRGVLILHGSAVRIGDGVVVFIGPSTAGKSTTAGLLAQRGGNVVCDDVCAITWEGWAAPHLHPGIPTLKLRGDTLEALNEHRHAWPRAAANPEKYLLTSAPAESPSTLPVRAVYVLARSGAAGLEALPSPAAVQHLWANVFRRNLLRGLGGGAHCFTQCARLASTVPVRVLSRTDSWDDTPRLMDCLEQDARSLGDLPRG